ncbi:cysteine--tRNA ligase [Vulgatibacter incomptus]|uniref:Cysteine--tRNA ligase n=1 Tax=Vulgatibacter incomptus TaxID=1391653 RepID=A0A0K1PB64_9BACT|nr:cysteine--tRNA ligase [Vulgatibacter incomptus]AKU90732.1 Cysteinyl-tRNA synthetase [Vulgatibacter incomptus]
MAQRLFSTLTNRKEDLVPREGRKIGMYVCGPTVYDFSHAGHARCYIVWDTVARWLRFTGYELKVVRNYTDVDDKIIRRANELGEDPSVVSERFIREFQDDMRALNVMPADVEPKVTEHIPEIIELIGKLIEKGHAYASEGDVYFAVRSFETYGQLSRRNLDDLLAGARVEPGERKRDPLDFALWKGAKPGEPFWESPWGIGRPGWHIECSAMSEKYLGPSFDLHGGGKDLVFPHHENELAQSEAASGQPLSRYWMHNGFLTINAEKMGKSLGNFFTIRELLGHVDGEAVRYTVLGTHYRSPLDFSLDAILASQQRVAYVYETLAKADERLARETQPLAEGPILHPERIDELDARFREAMEDDFNTAAALGAISELFPWMNELVEKPPVKDRALVARTLARLVADARRIGSILGVFEQPPAEWLARYRLRLAAQKGIEPSWVEARIAARAEARRNKDFAAADVIRAELLGSGVEIMDSPSGTTWRVIA